MRKKINLVALVVAVIVIFTLVIVIVSVRSSKKKVETENTTSDLMFSEKYDSTFTNFENVNESEKQGYASETTRFNNVESNSSSLPREIETPIGNIDISSEKSNEIIVETPTRTSVAVSKANEPTTKGEQVENNNPNNSEEKTTTSDVYDGYSSRFYADINGEKVFLYELCIGEKENGFLLGKAPDKNGEMNKIWINISKIEKKDTWTDEDFKRVNELQSAVNDLIQKIYETDGFVEES